MSLFTVPILTLTEIEPHPNADRLDLAVIGGFRAVVQKGAYSPGDRIAYLPTDSVVPPDVSEALGIGTYLVGKEKTRVKAIRLRGALSEGIVLPVAVVDSFLAARGIVVDMQAEPADLSEALGITKYEQPIPVSMQGKARPWPRFLPYYDIENVKRPEFRGVLQDGEEVVLTEKRHGTNMAVAWGPDLDEGEKAYVCSRGHALIEDETNLYWIAVRAHDLVTKLHLIRNDLEAWGVDVQNLSIHGEVLGCQDLRYGATMDKPTFEAFDIRINGRWMDYDEFLGTARAAGLPTVPELHRGPYDYDMLDGFAEGEAAGGHGHIREGVVIRPVKERENGVLGRVQLKYIGGSYLVRSGEATELR